VFGDPFFQDVPDPQFRTAAETTTVTMLEAGIQQPWLNLEFWFTSYVIRGPCFSRSLSLLPKGSTLKGVAMNFEHLSRIRKPVGTVLVGPTEFDLRDFDRTFLVVRREICS
jgi:hypothetical protein